MLKQLNSLSETFKRVPLWIYPLVVSLFLFPPADTYELTSDGWSYMAQGVNLVKGRSYTDVDGTPVTFRGPVFPMWFALAFRLAGVSVATAFVASRLFFLLNVLAVYFLGAKLFGRPSGLFASLLVLSSAGLSEWAALIHIDHVFSALVLLILLALLWSFEHDRMWRFVVTGCLIGVAYLLKELALLLLPLPVLVWVARASWRNKHNLYRVLVLFLAFFVTVVPWWVRIHTLNERAGVLGGEGGSGAFNTLLEAVITPGLGWIPEALASYYTNILSPTFGLASLFVLSWFVAIVQSLRRKSSELFCVLTALCFVPLLLFQGLEGWRAHQGMALFFLSYLVLARVMWSVIEYVKERLSLGGRAVRVLSVTIVSGSLGLQLTSENWRWLKHVERYNAIGFLRQDSIGVKGYWSENKTAADWLLANVESGSAILSDFSYSAALHFYSYGEFYFHETPLSCSPYYSMRLFKGCSLPSDEQPESGRPNVLFLWPDGGKGFLSRTNQSALVAFTEEQLLSAIDLHGIRHVVLPQCTGFQSMYFERSPNFLEVASFRRGYLKVYQVDGAGPVSFPLHIGQRLPKYLNDMKQQEPNRYNMLRDDYLAGALGFSPAEIKELEKGTIPNFNLARVYQTGVSGECLVGWTITVGEKGLDYTGHLIVGDDYGHALREMVARIYDAPAGGTCLWSQDFDKVHMSKGNFLLKLATADPNLFRYRVKGAPLFLEVSIDDCGPISPRQELTDEFDSQDPGLFVNIGRSYLQERIMSDACAAFDKALAVGGVVQKRRLDLARRQVTAARRAEARNLKSEATDAYRQAISTYLTELQRTAKKPSLGLDLGKAYESLGEVDEAVAAYWKTIEQDPSMAEAFVRLGSLLVQNGEKERAIELYREAVRMNPKASWPHLELGKIHLDHSIHKGKQVQ